MNLLPAVIHADYRGEFKILVAFNDGVESTIDFSDWLTGPVSEPLKDRAYCARFFNADTFNELRRSQALMLKFARPLLIG